MNLLFPIEPAYPSGFLYYPEFISVEEEKKLLHEISLIELHQFHFQGYEAKRKVASFGCDWSFEQQKLTKGKEIPAAFAQIIEKVSKQVSLPKKDFAELLVTEYPPGSVINWHRDAPPFDLIAGISLLSDCTFRLRPFDKTKQNRQSIISFPVQRRSLYIISGESRTDWQHSIAAVESTRYSITLRSLLKSYSLM